MKLLITTTPVIENARIEKYCGIVTSNVVLGVNAISDFVASFSDFFGGRSGTYQEKLEIIYRDIIKELELKAGRMQANAIIGLSLNFNEISGKNKQMFMATAIGTACKVEFEKELQVRDEDTTKVVSSSELERQYNLGMIGKELDKKDPYYRPPYDYIITNDMHELAPKLLRHWLSICERDLEYVNNANEKTNAYISILPVEKAKEAVYPLLDVDKPKILKVIKDFSLFDAKRILGLMQDGHLHEAISLLDVSQPTYTSDDLAVMKEIVAHLDNLPDTGRIETVMEGVFSKKEAQKFICEKGHKNDIRLEYCDTCFMNIKGLELQEVKNIEEFKAKVAALGEILK